METQSGPLHTTEVSVPIDLGTPIWPEDVGLRPGHTLIFLQPHRLDVAAISDLISGVRAPRICYLLITARLPAIAV